MSIMVTKYVRTEVEVDVEISLADLSEKERAELISGQFQELNPTALADAFYRGHDAVISAAREIVYAATGRIV